MTLVGTAVFLVMTAAGIYDLQPRLERWDYQRQFEVLLYGWPEGSHHYWCGARNQGDVWYVNKPQVNDLHPTMKPVELVERAVRNSSRRRDVGCKARWSSSPSPRRFD